MFSLIDQNEEEFEQPRFKVLDKVLYIREDLKPSEWQEYIISGIRIHPQKWNKEKPQYPVWEYCLVRPKRFGETWVIEDALCSPGTQHSYDAELQF